MADWRSDVLRGLGAPVTTQNLAFLSTWQRYEGGHTNNDARHNYLNTTLNAPGATGSINSVGVKAFASHGDGINATVATLKNGRYGGIVAGLRSGDPYRAPGVASGLSTWLSGKPNSKAGLSYAGKVLGQPVSAYAPPKTKAEKAGADAFVASPAGVAYAPFLMAQAQNLAAGGQFDLAGLTDLIQANKQAPSGPGAAEQAFGNSPAGTAYSRKLGGTLEELIHDPMREHYVDGGQRVSGAHGGHGGHVHVALNNPQAMKVAIQRAQRMGLSVRDNPLTDKVDPVHSKNSFHYRTFPGTNIGMGADISGDPRTMTAFYRWAASTFG